MIKKKILKKITFTIKRKKKRIMIFEFFTPIKKLYISDFILNYQFF